MFNKILASSNYISPYHGSYPEKGDFVKTEIAFPISAYFDAKLPT